MSARILIAGFKHETNTFSTLPTDLDAYRARALYYGGDVVKYMSGTKTEAAAYLDACRRYDWTPVPCIEANATPSGKVTQSTYETISAHILDCLTENGPFDGILLSLHGAMVAEHEDDGEGLLLERIRDAVGDTVPIAVTLDLHANVTDRMARHANILVSYRTYPHIDGYEIASQAAALLARTLAKEIAPRCVVARGQMLDGVDHGRTTAPGPMREVLASADRLLSQPGMLAASVNAGFPWVDIADTGPSAVIVYDANQAGIGETARRFADGLVQEIWRSRHRLTIDAISTDAAMARVGSINDPGDAPIVLSDFADNPGGGGYGDATRLLAAMLDSGLQNAAFATMYDPEVAAACHRAGLGATITAEVGNKVDPAMGQPLELQGEVTNINSGEFALNGPMNAGVPINIGPSAVLRVGGVDVVIVSARSQAYDLQYLQHAGIEPTSKAVIAVKSAHHFRAAFAPIASEILVVDGGGGLTSRNYAELNYERVRRPIYPLDRECC